MKYENPKNEDFFVIDIAVKPEHMEIVLKKVRELIDPILDSGDIGGFYFNVYRGQRRLNPPFDNHLKIGFFRIGTHKERVEKFVEDLPEKIDINKTSGDLNKSGEWVTDLIKCNSYEILRLTESNFGSVSKNINDLFNFIHLTMNQFSLTYEDELKLYEILKVSIEKTIESYES